mgnify:CR=1 FL=1
MHTTVAGRALAEDLVDHGLGHRLLNVSAMSAPDSPSASQTAATAPMPLPDTVDGVAGALENIDHAGVSEALGAARAERQAELGPREMAAQPRDVRIRRLVRAPAGDPALASGGMELSPLVR